jgi:Asp-tRNA(Asn)/Glu-tRNA(Gln) amidotransferase A subunit family amidase
MTSGAHGSSRDSMKRSNGKGETPMKNVRNQPNCPGHFAEKLSRPLALLLALVPSLGWGQTKSFPLMEATVADIHAAYRSKQLTSRQLVQLYLDRIAAYDKRGPEINSIITLNPKALEEADKLDAAFRTTGLVGPLHGIPVILKDQIDARGTPTTLGSILLKDYYPDRDAFVVEKLKKAGAIILAKATLGEFGGGDSHGSLYGSTRNPYGLDRTVGGSSGGSGGSMAANFGTLSVGQESNASIRRPSAWNSIVGMRPTAGLVSRSGVWAGWPTMVGSLGPMARTVADLAVLLDVMVGFDAEDPITALGVGNVPDTYMKFLDKNALKGAHIGVLRESIGQESEPDSEDFRKVTEVFEKAIGELKATGAQVVDPLVIPKLQELLAKRGGGGDREEASRIYFSRSARPLYLSASEMRRDYDKLPEFARQRTGGGGAPSPPSESSESRLLQSLLAREELTINVLKVMADHKLDAIVYKSVEHQPTLIRDGVNPPYVDTKGAPNLNTTLVFVPAISVPAGFTRDNLPVGITFQGRPYSEGLMIGLAYAYEQATHHRRPPSTTPALKDHP